MSVTPALTNFRARIEVLASDDGAYITGQVLGVDGGLTATQ